jgi:hypothetical protein
MSDFPDPFTSNPELLAPDEYPALRTISAAFAFDAVLVPRKEPPAPEFVFVPLGEQALAEYGALAQWNLAWEFGLIRPEQFRDEIPARLRWIEQHPETNFRLVPMRSTRLSAKVEAYGPLCSLIPLGTVRRFGVQPMRATWPTLGPPLQEPQADCVERIAQAFGHHVWPLLSSRSKPNAFSERDPLRILSHSLDFWLPYVDIVVQRRAKALGRVRYDDDEQRRHLEEGQRTLDPSFDADLCRPCFGGDAWRGEEEAWEATQEVVEVADERGRLRDVIDAIRSHRVHDDFSRRWSFEREDFERKLYSKRSKWKVAFVELNETVPVHSADAEVDVERRLLWQDFFSVLDEKEKRIVVCLRSGATTATEVADALGYANHSPVSKALRRIRKLAKRLL